MPAARPAPVAAAAIVAAALALSGGSGADPRTPAALPGMPPPFLGTAVVGDGGPTAAVDAYGDLVDLRPSPAGPALIDNPSDRQAAGTVAASTGVVPRMRLGRDAPLPPWRADSVRQRYLPGTNAVRTTSRFGRARLVVTEAASGGAVAVLVAARAPRAAPVLPALSVDVEPGIRCERQRRGRVLALSCATGGKGAPRASAIERARATFRRAARGDRRWLSRARPLGAAAPTWARHLYRRSLLVLHALTGRRTGALAAGARDGWAYVWPRDAATGALALRAAGYSHEARRVTSFLRGLDLGAAARFGATGAPVPGRAAQGDAAGWVAAARAGVEGDVAGSPATRGDAAGPPAAATMATSAPRIPAPEQWRDRSDYREGEPGDYLGNALAGAAGPQDVSLPGPPGAAPRPDVSEFSPHYRRGKSDTPLWKGFESRRGLVRRAEDGRSGLDSAAAWAVRPFAQPALYGIARETMLRLAGRGGRFGITPGESWQGDDPWMAPTAWTAWSLAALARTDPRRGRARRDRRVALSLLADLRRAATPAGLLPERVDANSGIPRSTTPLAWPHAFAVLALLELWPPSGDSPRSSAPRTRAG